MILERLLFFRCRSRAAAAFLAATGRCGDLGALCRLAQRHPDAPPAAVLARAAQRVGTTAERTPRCEDRPPAPAPGIPAAEPGDPQTWERHLGAEGSLEMQGIERYLSFLATVSSASPFIGLLGTVWGVMVAFLRIGEATGQAMLEVVGPGIAEALIATVAGLATAIPATVAFNLFNAAARRQRLNIESLGTQVVLLAGGRGAEDRRDRDPRFGTGE